ncbi:MAG TPA: ABC transporter permease [Candidatus Choladousia intestinavium]|uniref:ABC transporter permease n=1 Tax=Candidatus Choladousia intestinavium TaxID=2840727 RepID=A0A9D1D8Z6_9FIRM|nr:ABC transporter permease [Candidatus Choladousia intestinavium]
MKSYLSLVPISARVHRRQSRMTRICIILAVFLVTAIFSMAEMWIRGEQAQMIRKHGNYHIILQNIPEDKAESVRGRADVEAFSWYDDLNSDGEQEYSIEGRKIALYGIEEAYLSEIRNYAVEGSFPEKSSEVILSADAGELFGISLGGTVTLNTPGGDFTYTVTGFCQDDEEFNDMIDGCCMYMNKTAFGKVQSSNQGESASRYYVQFQEKTNLRKAIAGVRQQYGLSSENVDENTAVLGLTGASSNETVKNIYPLAAVCFLLILVSGVLMISGCMNSTVAQRIKFFGMMRCIGASRQQIMRFVRLEALNWCKTAIPEGCLLGVVVCWILCGVLRFIVRGEWADFPLFGVSVSGIVCGAAVGLVTVFLAAHSPAKQAAKVSPASAVAGNVSETGKTEARAAGRLFRVEIFLGIRHAVSARKNLVLMTGSFALTIMLFLTFSACLDVVHKLLPSVSDFSTDLTISSQDNTNSIDKSLTGQISGIAGVESVFGTMLWMECPVQINGNEETVDLFSYDSFMMENAEKSVVSGDLTKVYGDSDYVLTIFSQGGRLDTGDKIKIGGEEVKVACVVSEGIGSISGSAAVVCSEETFTRLTGQENYYMLNVILEENASEEAVKDIRDLAGSYVFTDNREDNSEVYGSYWVFRLAAYGFLAIISLITVLNIMNSISMSVTARIRQYGAMRAVGMECRQVTRMILAEAAVYAVSGTIVGILLGLLLHYLIYLKVILNHFGGSWEIPADTIVLILFLVFLSCIAAVYGPSKRIRNMAVTETINEL